MSLGTQSAASGSLRRLLALLWAGGIFALGGGLLIAVGFPPTFPGLVLPVAGALVFLLDAFAVRDRSRQPLSLAGVVLLAVALHHPPAVALLLALLSGLLIKPPRDWIGWQELLARRCLEAGSRAAALGLVLPFVSNLALLQRLLWLIVGYVLVVQGARWVFAHLWDASLRVGEVLTRSLVPSLLIEVLPLPLAVVGAEIARTFEWQLVALAAGGLVGSAVMVRRSVRSLGLQRRTVAELGQINAISRAIIRAELDVDALCNLIYSEASRVVDTHNFRLGLFNGQQFELKVRVHEGTREPPLVVNVPEDHGLVGWMRRTGRSLLVHDFDKEMSQLPARPTYQADLPPRSGIYIPLFTGDEVIGTISIQSRLPNAFDTEDLRILSLIADQAATAIEKARVYAAARQRATQLAIISEVSRQITAILDLQRLLPIIVQRIRASFGYYQVHLFTVDSQSDDLLFRASTNPDSPFWQRQGQRLASGLGIVGHVMQTGEPLLVNDVTQEPLFIADMAGIAAEIALPLRVGTQLLGVLDVQSDRIGAFDENDVFVLQTLADQIAIAIDSANIFTAQQEEAWVLNALLQAAENIAWTTDLKELLDTAVRLLALLLGCDRVFCLLWQRDERAWSLAAMWGRTDLELGLLHSDDSADPALALLESVRNAGEPELVAFEHKAKLEQSTLLPACDYGAVLALPLTTRANTLGVLLLDKAAVDAAWMPRQVTIATGIAGQIAAAVEGALLSHAEAERQHLEQEITVARELQTSLLPPQMPQLSGWDTAALWRSARQVGGDFYDFWHFTSGPAAGELGFVIADVSDKGVPAALFMALARSLVRASALDGTSPARAMERANRWIVRDSQAYMFVTLFYAILDPESGELRYCCAGHNPPLLYRAASGTVEHLRTPGIALGVLDEVTLGEAATMLEPGDLLLCYTDGVTESINDVMDEWGLERLIETIKAHANLSTQELLDAISAGLAAHTGERPPFDDVTMLAVKRISNS